MSRIHEENIDFREKLYTSKNPLKASHKQKEHDNSAQLLEAMESDGISVIR